MAFLKLYTTGIMDEAFYYYAGSQAAGHPKENMQDDNLDTYWKPTSASTTQTKLDLSEPKLVSCTIVFLKNYKEITSGTLEISYYSGGWSTVTNISLVDQNTPIRLITFTPRTYQEWMITYYSPSHAPEVAAGWCGQLFEVNLGNVLPQENEDQFYSREVQLPGGRLAVPGLNRNRVENFSRRYLIKSDNADLTDLRNAYQASCGRRHPLVMNEGAAQSDARVVRFADDILSRPTVGYDGLHEIEIGLRGVPYIDDGDSY